MALSKYVLLSPEIWWKCQLQTLVLGGTSVCNKGVCFELRCHSHFWLSPRSSPRSHSKDRPTQLYNTNQEKWQACRGPSHQHVFLEGTAVSIQLLEPRRNKLSRKRPMRLLKQTDGCLTLIGDPAEKGEIQWSKMMAERIPKEAYILWILLDLI